eukprot:scaffold2879_cov128-Skeletonema_dohrnii-CCMP3373.AAC.12
MGLPAGETDEEQRSKPYRGARRRLQMTAGGQQAGGALRLQSQTTVLDDHQVNNDRRSVNRQSIFSSDVTTCNAIHHLCQRSQLSAAALTLISQLSIKSKCISTNPFASE